MWTAWKLHNLDERKSFPGWRFIGVLPFSLDDRYTHPVSIRSCFPFSAIIWTAVINDVAWWTPSYVVALYRICFLWILVVSTPSNSACSKSSHALPCCFVPRWSHPHSKDAVSGGEDQTDVDQTNRLYTPWSFKLLVKCFHSITSVINWNFTCSLPSWSFSENQKMAVVKDVRFSCSLSRYLDLTEPRGQPSSIGKSLALLSSILSLWSPWRMNSCMLFWSLS